MTTLTQRGRNRRTTVSTPTVPSGKGIKIEESVIIHATPQELYSFWRQLENLPLFMWQIKSVTRQDDRVSHWTAGSLGGKRFEWNAEIINDRVNEMIAWRSLTGADVDHAGSVWFEAMPGDRQTRVKVAFEFVPPVGKMARAVAKLFGRDPAKQLREDLGRLKALMEAVKIATNKAQPALSDSKGGGANDWNTV